MRREAITTMESRLSATIAEPRFRSVLLLVVSAVALALAAIGIYGVVAYAVTERTREMGIRIALGASRWSVVHLVLGGTARVTVPGLVLGLGVSWAATRVLSAFLFQVEPRDAVVFASGSAILLAVSLIACYAPARRASRIDPIITMK